MFEGKAGAYPSEAPFTFLAPGVSAIKRFFFVTDIWTLRQECLTQGGACHSAERHSTMSFCTVSICQCHSAQGLSAQCHFAEGHSTEH